MRRARRFPHRLVRWISVCVCLALIASTLFVVPLQNANAGTGNSSRSTSSLLSGLGGILAALLLPPYDPPSVPGDDLPDLDTMRALSPSNPAAPDPTPSERSCPDCTPCPTCGSNHAPLAIAGATYHGYMNQSVQFNGDSSFDADGDATTWSWNFGDNTTGSGPTPTHTYSTAGTYTVTLTVTDNHDASDGDTSSAVIVAAPPTISQEPDGSGNDAHFVSQSVPDTMITGHPYPVSVTMRNNGTTTWSAAHLYRLGSQNAQDNLNWGTARVYLPMDVEPGADVTFNFTVVPTGGEHKQFQWRMVQDAVEWFGAYSTNKDVTFDNGSSSSSSEYTPGDHYSARLEARNRTGSSGDDLLSRNFNWSTGLLGLQGRSGLDLGLSLSYNSFVWTRVESGKGGIGFLFDADRGFPGPGFRLGFPTIQGPFTNHQADVQSYLLITPSGGHLELRQVSTNVYESFDSSYLQLIDDGEGGLLLRDTSGRQMSYLLINEEYHCTSIKDRNGNYISIRYESVNGEDTVGRMTSIVDTLGRTINFNYDENYRLQTITQNGNGQTHVWASFGYTTLEVRTNFKATSGAVVPLEPRLGGPGEGVLGVPEDGQISVLTQVGLADGSRYRFDYTTWGQVWKISHLAANEDLLNYTSYDLPLDGDIEELDCPRFNQRQDWAKNWNDENEAVTTYAYNSEAIDHAIAWDNVTWSQATMPDGTKYREYTTAGYDDWRRGLVTKTEVYSADSSNEPKKTTERAWTQDLTSVGYQLNPRVTSNLITDSDGNRNLTGIEYTSFGLPFDVFQWGPAPNNGWALLKRTHTDYELSQPYLDRRIIGLPKQQFLFSNEDNQQRLYNKQTYQYDVDSGICQGICTDYETEAAGPSVVQHDGNNYGPNFNLGRGLVTRIMRWDANGEIDGGISFLKYNSLGSLIRTSDPLGRLTTISYTDSFSHDGTASTTIPYSTMAYPTMVTNAGGFVSTMKYDYDLGTPTRKQDPFGAAQTMQFDAAGRVVRVTNVVNSGYTRFVYPSSQTIVNQFTTINDLNTEAYSATISDGFGRVRATASDFPNSAGHYSGFYTSFDVAGRAVLQTNRTEMNHVWTASGDDSVGWYSTTQTYDWNGRPLVTTNQQDGLTKQASYGGCGCAGGLVVTLMGEQLNEGRRTHRVSFDALGREKRNEFLDWSGNVYATTVNTYNARDQITRFRQYAGTEGSGSYQDTIQEYDGLGRLHAKHMPEQDAGTSTTYTYDAADQIQSVTDARGAASHYLYNARGLVTQMSYTVPPSSTIAVPASVAFGYDAAGNRTSMTDGMGTMSYEYDQLSRMVAETRQFNEPVDQTPASGNFRIEYTYGLNGQLATITDPYGERVNYSHDLLGRLKQVTGDLPGGSALQYTTNAEYRAWGAPKAVIYGSGMQMQMNYNHRQQAVSYSLVNRRTGISWLPFDTASIQYQYYEDGRLRLSNESISIPNINPQAPLFARSYEYDFMGRLTMAKTGAEAHGQVEPDYNKRPYRQGYSYDAFAHQTDEQRYYWTEYFHDFHPPWIYENNRRVHLPYPGGGYYNTDMYDADGRRTGEDANDWRNQFRYDAAGRQVYYSDYPDLGFSGVTISFDGLGRPLKSIQTGNYCASGGSCTHIEFFIKSTVLDGETLTEVSKTYYPTVPGVPAVTDLKHNTYIFAAGARIGRHEVSSHSLLTYLDNDTTYLENRDASGAFFDEQVLRGSGNYWQGGNGTNSPNYLAEMDPFGAIVGPWNPYLAGNGGYGGPSCPGPEPDDCGDDPDEEEYDGTHDPEQGYGNPVAFTCYDDNGFERDCKQAFDSIRKLGDGRVTRENDLNPPSDSGPQAIWQPEYHTTSSSEFYGIDAEDAGNKDRAIAAVTINDADEGQFIWSDSDWDPQAQSSPGNAGQASKVAVSKEDKEAFRKRIEAMLKIKKCQDFLKELLEEVKTETGTPYTDILTTFNQMRFYWGSGKPSEGGNAYHEGDGTPAANIEDAYITEKPSGSVENRRDRRGTIIRLTTQEFLAETLHATGQNRFVGYLDGQFANALNAILVKKGLDTPKAYSDKTYLDSAHASGYWHPNVWTACPAPSE